MKNTMKKLMITLAAAGLVGSAWAGCGDSDGCLVYDLKVTLKTLGPKAQKCKATCADETVYYLDTVTRSLKGYAWSCEYDCECDGSGKTELQLALWEPKAELGWWLYDTNGEVADQKIDVLKQTIRFAKKGSKAAVWFDVENADGTDWSTQCRNSTYKVASTLRFVGFGTAAKNKNLNSCIVKSVSGNVIGDVTPDVRCAKTSTKKGNWCDDDVTECCNDYDIRWACLCNCDVDWCDDIDQHVELKDATDLPNGRVPAYGTWSMKYNASLSSSKSKVKLTDKLPKYATK